MRHGRRSRISPLPLGADCQCRRDGRAAGWLGHGAYSASKAGVHRLTEALAAEWKGKITVNAVLPSTIDTPANRASMPKADFGKWVTPQELADVILFCEAMLRAPSPARCCR